MEIFSNTILKLLVRQGSDTDRQKIVFTSGEPVFTTDTRRFFVGTGTLSGGVLVGNLYQGTNPDITTLSPCELGDYAFDSDKNKLYRLKTNDGSLLTDWELIGGVYSSGDNHVSISADNEITLNALSANSISSDLVKSPIILDSGKISLSANIPFTTVSTKTITVSSGLMVTSNGTNVSNTAINPLSSNLVIQSNVLFAKYSGLSGQALNYSRGVTSVNRLSAGDYTFNFGPLNTLNLIPIVNIFGEDVPTCVARATSVSVSSCQVKVLSSNGATTDANVTLTIHY